MNKEKFFQYINDFNKGDYEKVVSTYYTEDIIFDTADYRHEGREEVKKFFIEIHKGMEETLRPENVLVEGDRIAVDMWGDLYFSKDKPEFRLRPMKKGESLKVRWFIFYDTKDDKICKIQLARRSVEVKAGQP
jgi:ketosteroid isomerase-like protein